MHFTYLSPIIHDQNWQKMAMAMGVAVVMCLVGAITTRRIKKNIANGTIENLIVPSEKVSLFGVLDLIIETFVKFADTIIGKENRKHVPFVATFFFFILICNLLSLIPGVPAATTTVWLNVAMALSVFVYFNYQGIKENGLVNYIKHFCGPSGLPLVLAIFIAPLLLPIELLSTTLRILTLNLRLYWNISADHIVVDVFVNFFSSFPSLLKLLALPFYVLGTFVSFMQAFIFTVLTMLYIVLATEHEEE